MFFLADFKKKVNLKETIILGATIEPEGSKAQSKNNTLVKFFQPM